MRQVAMWDEWGLHMDPRELPAYEYEALHAILRGRGKKRQRDAERQRREAEQAKRKGRR